MRPSMTPNCGSLFTHMIRVGGFSFGVLAIMKKISFLVLLLCGCGDSTSQSDTQNLDAGSADLATSEGRQDATTTDSSPDDSNPSDANARDSAAVDVTIPSTSDAGEIDGAITDSGAVENDGMVVDIDANMATNERTIWNGPRITFTKVSRADPNTPEAQDAITENVVLTRGNGNILYNIAQEMGVNQAVSPLGTLWSMGTTAELDELNFQPLKRAANNRMQAVPGRDMVLFLVDENIYIDLRFISWQPGNGSGGGFSYERTTPGDN